MRSTLAFIFILVISITACEPEKAPLVCGGEDPLNDLPWLKEMVVEYEQYKDSYLVQADLHGNTVFFFGSCCTACNWAIIPYDCDGGQLKIANLKFESFESWKIIWTPENTTCAFM